MTAQLFDGKAIAFALQQDLRSQVDAYRAQGNRAPTLAVILVGTDPASAVYVKNKHQACANTGIISKSLSFDKNLTQGSLLALIDELNQDPTIDGILVQLPLPTHIDTNDILEHILPGKDVDGFHPYNLGRLVQQRPFLRPCTPYGIMLMLESAGLAVKGLNATVVGVSNIVGRPMVLELLMAGCTPTACHRFTKNLSQAVSEADLLVVATGVPHLIKGDWIKPGAIVIDVGMNRLSSGKFIGDVEFEIAKTRASWITPVPGGVGPMTVAVLLQNTMIAYKMHLNMEQNI